MQAYYNENDRFAAQWLRNLIAAKHIAQGDVDDRSIVDVRPADLRGYTQCHFFAGIGVWSYALRSAGWPDDRQVWTGSCPCQPFSAAGKGAGFDDERHLWPAFHHLIRERSPDVVFGEQVASKDGLAWLDLVQADMEGTSYAFGTVDTCAAGFGAPHIRQRLYWVADAMRPGRPERRTIAGDRSTSWCGEFGGLAHSDGGNASAKWQQRGGEQRQQPQNSGAVQLADTDPARLEIVREQPSRPEFATTERGRPAGPAGPTNGLWRDADWLFCRDGKWRPVEARIQQVADGIALRVGPMCADLQAKVEEMLNEAAIRLQAEASEILREMREAIGCSRIFQWGGGLRPVYEAQILLACLFEYTREKGREQNAENGSSAGNGAQRDVRMLWWKSQAFDSPCERGLAGQQHQQFANSLHLLSSAVARFASEAGYPHLYEDAPASFPLGVPAGCGGAQDPLGFIRPKNRVGRLRGYGNAINAEQAQGFIEAYLECCP